MRNIIIDTDTASDDAVAIIMALRDPDVCVKAITTVAGNMFLPQSTRNALISVEMAGTYAPPVYEGMDRPLVRDQVTAHSVHGIDGLGDVGYPDPKGKPLEEHAVNAIIRILEESSEPIEIVALGPLSNVALAIRKSPAALKKVKRITLMGSAGLGFGNSTPVAEFNIWADPEAAHIVLSSGLPVTVVGWDACLGKAILSVPEIDELLSTGSPLAKFCIDCNGTLRKLNDERFGEPVIDFADPVAMAAAIYPECIAREVSAYACVELKSEATYGEVVVDHVGILKKPFNSSFVVELDAPKFKDYLKRMVV